MKLDRKSLVEALEICKPALSTQNRAVELSHYWCDGETIGAYNGRLMILQPFPYDIIGGIPDNTLDWLKKVETPEINLTGSGDRITLTAGRASRINLTLLDASRRIFSPDIALNELGVPPLPLDPDLIAALENVSVSQDKQATAPQKLGVFFHPHEGCLDLYATDDYTITKQRIELSNEFSDSLLLVSHIVVPFGLVDQIIKHKKTKDSFLYISDTFIVLYAEPTTIMSSLIECPKMPNFSEIIDSFEAPLITLPEAVVDAVDRLSQIGGAIEVTVNDNNLILASEALGSRAEEQFPLEGSNPGGIVIKLDPKLLKRVIKDRTHIGIKPKGLYATGPERYIHIMAGLR